MTKQKETIVAEVINEICKVIITRSDELEAIFGNPNTGITNVMTNLIPNFIGNFTEDEDAQRTYDFLKERMDETMEHMLKAKGVTK